MNEEAMTPDKEQVVSPLSAPHTPDEWRAFFRERGWVITMDDRPGQAFDAFVHIADAARTASVAGLDRLTRAAADLVGTIERGDPHAIVLVAASGVNKALAALNSAPSIEQEPGAVRTIIDNALMTVRPDVSEGAALILEVMRDTVVAALREQEPGETEYDGHSFYEDPIPGAAGECDYSYRNGERCGHDAAFHWHEREQEPGETLRAADLRRALRANRHAPDIARDPMANQWNRGIDRALEIVDRLALEADRNPQETERRVLVCTMNESSASAHGHTDACYETVRNPQ